MSGGRNVQLQGTETGSKIPAHLPPPICEIPDVCTQTPAVEDPAHAAPGDGAAAELCHLSDIGALNATHEVQNTPSTVPSHTEI